MIPHKLEIIRRLESMESCNAIMVTQHWIINNPTIQKQKDQVQSFMTSSASVKGLLK